MKGELKAGGLALIYGLREHPSYNGRSCTLVKVVPDMESAMVSASQGLPPAIWWRVTGLMEGKTCRVRAENLLPIDGDPDQEPEQLTKDKPVEVTA